MNNIQPDVNEEIRTLPQLLACYDKIEIPLIQRDYAQGRNDDNAKLVRDKLLSDMKAAITGQSPPLDLNFVYGKVHDGIFVPLDGQQRLTTLFLLYLYAFHSDPEKSSLLHKFSYETRTSSRAFITSLIEHRSEIFSPASRPAQQITDAAWFESRWQADPTVQSALKVLDTISEVFAEVPDLAARLEDNSRAPMYFEFLPIDNLGEEDDLYIKLNARVRPLTPFENFKAQLLERLAILGDSVPSDLSQQFPHLIDNAWTDFFWDSESPEQYDVDFLTFFQVLARNLYGINDDGDKETWLSQFNFGLLGREFFAAVYYTLNYVSEHPDSEAAKLLRRVTERRGFTERLLFHAVTTYLTATRGQSNLPPSIREESFDQWLRIFSNLARNTEWNRVEQYLEALPVITQLTSHVSDLLTYVAEGGEFPRFNTEQVAEEREKARLLLADQNWVAPILAAEAHPYFEGQIRAGLIAAATSPEGLTPQTFNNYWNKIASLFAGRSVRLGNQLRRTLLALGDYTIPIGDFRTLGPDNPEITARTPGLKRAFSVMSAPVVELLDSLTGAENDLPTQLQHVIDAADIPQSDWRYGLVKFGRLSDPYTYMNPSDYRLHPIADEGWLLIQGKSTSGYNTNLFLAGLKEYLAASGITSDIPNIDRGFIGRRRLQVGDYRIRYHDADPATGDNGKFVVSRLVTPDGAAASEIETPVLVTGTEAPYTEVLQFLTRV